MEPDDPYGDDEHRPGLLPLDDRLWRHPSEVNGQSRSNRRRTRSPQIPGLWMMAVLAGVFGATAAVGLMAATGNLRRVLKVPVVERVALPPGSLPIVTGQVGPGVVRVSRRLGPAIVRLEVEFDGTSEPAVGAGVVFRSDGHLFTNQHLVSGAKRIVVVMEGGRRTEGTLVGGDEWSDVAVVKVDDGITVPVAPMGSVDRLAVGQRVMAVGGVETNSGEPSMVVAVVGALGRQLDREGAPSLLDMIQTNTPVPPTSSGGALVDDSGAVVGITTALRPADAPSMASAGFAIPIDWAQAVAEQLLSTGKVVRVWLGIEGGDLDTETALAMGVGGAAVVNVVRSESPAGNAGLKSGDIITSVDGVVVGSMSALRVLLRTHHPDDTVTLKIARGKATRSLKVHLVERPSQT